jgi:glycosyltransferase involved in cell wall biosynthesis
MRNVLIFSGIHSYSALSASNPGSKNSVRMAHHLIRHGWRPVVVTQYKGLESDQHPVNLEDIPAYLSSFDETSEVVVRIKAEPSLGSRLIRSSQRMHNLHIGGKLLSPIWNGIGSGITGLARFLGDSHESGGGWSSIAARTGIRIADTIKIDAMLAITGWDAVFAGYRCHLKTGIPWIQIYHDPWREFIKPIGRPFLAIYLNHLILRSAAALSHCTPAWTRDMEKELHRPVTCLVNAYDAEQMAAAWRQQFDRFTVVYAGTVEPEVRDPRVFFAGMSLLRSEMPALADKIKFIYIGSQGDFLRKRAQEYGVSDLVQTLGSLSAPEVLPYIKGAHLLLMFLNQTNPFLVGCLSAKSAEYIGSGRPILLVSKTKNNYETDLIRLVRDTGSGWVAQSELDVVGILRKALEQYEASGDTFPPGGGCYAIGNLSYEHQAQKLAALLERIAQGERDPLIERLEDEFPWSRAD